MKRKKKHVPLEWKDHTSGKYHAYTDKGELYAELRHGQIWYAVVWTGNTHIERSNCHDRRHAKHVAETLYAAVVELAVR